jgi:pimeloyl-ACP methyl ester carboxylesterase
MATPLTHATVRNENCDLHYWHHQAPHQSHANPFIIFVPGGNGHGRQFLPLMAALSALGYPCATFDRRQMSASQLPSGSSNKRLSPPQQARDIRAVIRACGHEKAIVFGSSSGGIFALQFAHDFPQMVDRLVAHEAPLTGLLPDASAVCEWMLHLVEVCQRDGWRAAAGEFGEKLVGYDDKGLPACAKPEEGNVVNFWENEFLVLLGYVPNLWRIREKGTRVGVMRAVRCRDAFYARAVEEQAKILGCPKMLVPGHHQGFEVEVDEFLPAFLEILETLEKGCAA